MLNETEKRILRQLRRAADTWNFPCIVEGCESYSAKNHTISKARLRKSVAENSHMIELNASYDNGQYEFRRVGINQDSSQAIHFRSFCAEHDNEYFKEIDQAKDLELCESSVQSRIMLRAIAHEYHKQLRWKKVWDSCLSHPNFTVTGRIDIGERQRRFRWTIPQIRRDMECIIGEIKKGVVTHKFFVLEVASMNAYFNFYFANYLQNGATGEQLSLANHFVNYSSVGGKSEFLLCSSGDRRFSVVDDMANLTKRAQRRFVQDLIMRFAETWAVSEGTYYRLERTGKEKRLLNEINRLAPIRNKMLPSNLELFKMIRG